MLLPFLRLRAPGAPASPPLPVEPPYALGPAEDGAFRCWGVLMATPGLWHRRHASEPARWIDVDRADMERWVEHHATLKAATGYEPPMLRVHNPELADGRALGYIEALQIAKGRDGADYLLAVLRWAIPDAEAAVKRGEFRYLSPGLGPYHDDAGRAEERVVVEASVCPDPYQKRLGATHLLLSVGATMEMQAILDNINASLEDLKARIAALEETAKADMAAEPAPEPDMPAMDMSASLKAHASALGLDPASVATVERAAKLDPALALDLCVRLRPVASAAPPKSDAKLSAPVSATKVQGAKPADLQTTKTDATASAPLRLASKADAATQASVEHPTDRVKRLERYTQLVTEHQLD